MTRAGGSFLQAGKFSGAQVRESVSDSLRAAFVSFGGGWPSSGLEADSTESGALCVFPGIEAPTEYRRLDVS